MEWLEKYEVGHEKIDLEHRIFFELVQTIGKAAEQGASKDKIRRLIAETGKYTEFHFLSEENLMIDVGYPEFSRHKAHHEDLLKKLQINVVHFESGKSDVSELVKFLNKWFFEHTINEDSELSKYLNNVS